MNRTKAMDSPLVLLHCRQAGEFEATNGAHHVFLFAVGQQVFLEALEVAEPSYTH